ncbi:YoaP domain-containing protein [Salipaludibacillus agaradhaerens]|uniref:YoaP domain-containing protein n=1 Tax=Salipaludibacillus agaradhaerens TaxID=76935 RepID=A0A9Q4B4W1_SALAG|nr:N-acetyltransferase [Salipaludibacillus agaradhaerens]MCR6098067.1 YoaP domain-containing protein [Salipaludibacillus agaradhaerens]MCR6116304.1 YoaP domain-containing protein [Salipaludibacillus agaradhaerens]
MTFIHISETDLNDLHICCALGAKQYSAAIDAKKAWLSDRMKEGLVFYRLDDRAKVFIEYLPVEAAWAPIHAPNYMFINCLWVSGRHQGGGHATHLLDRCKEDAISRGMDGIVHIAGSKKFPFLSDPRFLKHMGFNVVDKVAPYFQLYAHKFHERGVQPTFKTNKPLPVKEHGIDIFYTAQCPFASGLISDLEAVALAKGIPFHTYEITSREEAQKAPSPWTTFSIFYNGTFQTHRMMSVTKFEDFLENISTRGTEV